MTSDDWSKYQIFVEEGLRDLKVELSALRNDIRKQNSDHWREISAIRERLARLEAKCLVIGAVGGAVISVVVTKLLGG